MERNQRQATRKGLQKRCATVNEFEEADSKSATFNVINLPGGVYFYRLRAGKFVDVKKMVLILASSRVALFQEQHLLPISGLPGLESIEIDAARKIARLESDLMGTGRLPASH